MTDIKQDVKVFVKVFIQVFVSSVVKESTKKMIKNLSQRQRKLLEAKSKKMSNDQLVQYFDKSSFFKKTMENTVKSVCDLPSSKGIGSLVGKLESIYETTSTFNNPINTLILPASKTIVAVTASTAAVATTVFIIMMPTANFTIYPTEGPAPLSVEFIDQSKNVTGWYWEFGDGAISTEQNPVHTYSAEGVYTVKLKVSNNNLTDSKSAKIKVWPPVLPVANFETNTTFGNSPLSVAFTDLSQNATSWSWDFDNNGQYDSTIQSPVHVYEYPGTYTVNLTVSNANGINSKTADIIVEKEIAILPTANFNMSNTTGYPPLSVAFNDTSQYATSRSWDINGDGIEDSKNASFVHVYTIPGNYTVNLTAINANGTNFKLATINVSKLTPTISWSNPANITYGTTLNNITQLNAYPSVPGTFLYTPNAGTVLGAGTHTLHVDFTPNDTTNYSNISSNVTINVAKAIPVITWNNPSDVINGTTLENGVQLNASSPVLGTFVYTPKPGTVLSEGTHTLRADFMPADTVNYTSYSKNVTIKILPATLAFVDIIDFSQDIMPYEESVITAKATFDSYPVPKAYIEIIGQYGPHPYSSGYTPNNGTIEGIFKGTYYKDYVKKPSRSCPDPSREFSLCPIDAKVTYNGYTEESGTKYDIKVYNILYNASCSIDSSELVSGKEYNINIHCIDQKNNPVEGIRYFSNLMKEETYSVDPTITYFSNPMGEEVYNVTNSQGDATITFTAPEVESTTKSLLIVGDNWTITNPTEVVYETLVHISP